MTNTSRISRILRERFGDPIGAYAGDAPAGVRSEQLVCPECGMMQIDGACGCDQECPCGQPPTQCGCDDHPHGMRETDTVPCSECGMLEVEGSCGCVHEYGP